MMKKEKKNSWLLVVAPIAAALMFVGIFLTVEKKVLSDYEVSRVVTAKTEIEEGTQVTKENLDTLFIITNMRSEYVIDQAVTEPKELVGCVIDNTVHAKEMISKKDVINRQDWMESLEEPIEFTFTASSVSTSVGGTIRGGDVIDVGITQLQMDGKAAFVSVGREIYVKEVYDDGGLPVPRSDKETVCTMFRVVMDKAEGEEFLESLRTGDEVIVTLPD